MTGWKWRWRAWVLALYAVGRVRVTTVQYRRASMVASGIDLFAFGAERMLRRHPPR